MASFMHDSDLLRRFALEQDQTAFAELARRHGDWVYSAARRQLGDEHLAEDVTQAVFLLLARKAARLQRYAYLQGWLLQTLRYCAKEVRRQRLRQSHREREAATMRQDQTTEAAWQETAPVLDEAVLKLSANDRDSLLLRFYQGYSFAQVADAMHISEDAAKKRVQRAMERLRRVLAKKSVGVGAAALSAMLAENASAAAPAKVIEGVIATVSHGGTGTVAGMIAKGAMKMMWIKAKLAVAAMIAGVCLIGGAATIGAQHLGTPAPSPASQPTSGLPQYSVLGDSWTHIRFEVSRTAEREKQIGGDVPSAQTVHFDARTGTTVYDTQFAGRREVRLKSPSQRQQFTYDSRTNQVRVDILTETAQQIRERIETSWSMDWEKLREMGMIDEEPKVSAIPQDAEGGVTRYRVEVLLKNPEMQPDLVELWIDHERGLLTKSVSAFRGETTTLTFTHGEPAIQDIYDVGVPRDAIVVQEKN